MNRVPKLRFKEFSNEWEEKRLGEYYPFIRNGFVGIATPFYCDDGIKYLQSNNIHDGKINEKILKYITKEFHVKNIKNELKEDDILMVQSGHAGECAVVGEKYAGCNCHALIILSSNKKSNSHFVSQFLNSKKGKKGLYSLLTGNTITHILASDIKKHKIFFSCIKEQDKIADFLSSVDKKISITEEKLSLFNEYKKGIMQKIFNQELRFKDENGNDYPEWNLVTTKEISKITMGFTPSTKDESMWNGEYKWLSIADLKENGKYIHKTSKTITEKSTKNKKILKKGTLIMSFKLTLGRLGIISEEMFTNEAICHFNWNNENSIDTEYVYYYLNSIDISSFGKQAVKGITLNTESLNSIEINLPCLEEQQKIADFLSVIDTKIEKISDELENLKEFKKGLLQQMFV